LPRPDGGKKSIEKAGFARVVLSYKKREVVEFDIDRTKTAEMPNTNFSDKNAARVDCSTGLAAPTLGVF
jgi:hypothetical protein